MYVIQYFCLSIIFNQYFQIIDIMCIVEDFLLLRILLVITFFSVMCKFSIKLNEVSEAARLLARMHLCTVLLDD